MFRYALKVHAFVVGEKVKDLDQFVWLAQAGQYVLKWKLRRVAHQLGSETLTAKPTLQLKNQGKRM